MNMLYEASKALSIILFLYYGLSVLLSDAMVTEFERFGLVRFRKATGVLELLGSLGLILGYFLPHLTVAAAAGLTLLMAAGVFVRLRCRDSLADTLPAFGMLLMNLYVAIYALGVLTSPGR
ncbi:MAG: DoxX family protein [Actinomycetia bacterium]|nr:DoxX family protein [Actinomycetes bacterium]MCH9709855.1 DoxX family protein [Actinomycetes bacterium]